METKTFGDKKVVIRKMTKADLRNAKKFQVFINSLVKEEAKLLINKEATLKDEREFVKSVLKGMKSKTKVYLLAECDNKIIGSTDVTLRKWRENHIGIFGITIIKDYRGIGLGRYLISEIIKSAKKELRPKLKMIQLEVYANNEPAIGLYKKMGFKQVAQLPKQVQHKGKLVDILMMNLAL